MAICPIFPVLLFLMLCNISKVTIVLSVINWLGTKALCDSEITMGKISFSQSAKTLETILDYHISKTNRPIICHIFWLIYFGDEDNMGVIHLVQHVTQ